MSCYDHYPRDYALINFDGRGKPTLATVTHRNATVKKTKASAGGGAKQEASEIDDRIE